MKQLFLFVVAILFSSCNLTDQSAQNLKQIQTSSILDVVNINSSSTSAPLNVAVSLNHFDIASKANIKGVDFNGIWVVLDQIKDGVRTVNMNVSVTNKKCHQEYYIKDYPIYIKNKSTTLFLPEQLCKLNTKDVDNQLAAIVLEGNQPHSLVSSDGRINLNLDIAVKDTVLEVKSSFE